MKNILFLLLSIIIAVLLPFTLYGQDLFAAITSEETEVLKAGGILSRSLKNEKRLLINSKLNEVEDLMASLSGLNPNYISEVTSIIPLKEDMDVKLLFGKLERELNDINGFASISYFSKKWNKTFNLYDWLKIESISKTKDGFSSDVVQSMQPFGEMRIRYSLSQTEDSLYFTSENLSSISYKSVKAVKPGNMEWYLSAFVYKDSLVLYGVGAARAFDMFGVLRSRLEPAFVGRAEAFFMSIIKGLDI